MAEEKLPKVEAETQTPTTTKKVTLAVDIPTADESVFCEVCGHENPKGAAICAMCSNYLR